MVQPKTPPLSIRFPPAMMARVDQVSASTGETRHATIIALVSLGLQQTLILQDVKVRALPEPGAAAFVPISSPPSKAAVKVSVPLIERKAFNPQPKKGKGK